ncbi:MAG TPA: hypothetical protein VNT26_12545 [Candidatus Sulfotelmatobacter sp.]|nr:hypothetical protein [Candidatus Sulfotelmatobacter sp.]
MNQLATAQKRFPKAHQDIAADYFALRKIFTGAKWVFTEEPNPLNPASHCDIAWSAALASHAHTERRNAPGAAVIMGNGWFDGREWHPFTS